MAVAIAVFFVIWGLLQEGGDETPWIPAGVAASIVLSGAVLLREGIFRAARNRLLETQRQLDRNLRGLALNATPNGRSDKLTLDRNSAILHEIRQKSEAARVLGSMANGHREVVELCAGYLSINTRELARVGPGSPRLAQLLKGKDIAEDLHYYHTLRWTEIEARSLTSEASSKSKASEKIKVAEKALSVVESALLQYPEEPKLISSADALREFIAATRVSNWIEKAEGAAFRGNYRQARKLYNDALFFINRRTVPLEGQDLAVDQINKALEKINQLDGR